MPTRRAAMAPHAVTPARRLGLRRRVRRVAGGLIRRWGLLPEGDPDGLGDDDALRGTSLDFAVMVYFPDTRPNLYQLRQWYRPLAELNARHRVGVVCLDSRTAAAVRSECDLPVVCCGRIGTLEDLVSRSDVVLALYVNHNVRNLYPLRFATMLHVYLGHGESDKVASASNQVKAYDFVLVAGEAGRDRLHRNLIRYDVGAHVRLVGRPQLDDGATGALAGPERREGGAGRPTVLYAPTWEGAQPSMAYSSVVSHGGALLRSLLQSREFRVIYRPHPRTGANRADFAAADQQLRALVRSARGTDRDGGHEVDLTPTWSARRDPADILISDVSAVATDWMATGRPIVVTQPTATPAVVDADSVLHVVPGLTTAEATSAARVVREALADRDAGRRRRWVKYTLGETSPGASTERFLSTCEDLVALRGRELAARTARLAALRS